MQINLRNLFLITWNYISFSLKLADHYHSLGFVSQPSEHKALCMASCSWDGFDLWKVLSRNQKETYEHAMCLWIRRMEEKNKNAISNKLYDGLHVTSDTLTTQILINWNFLLDWGNKNKHNKKIATKLFFFYHVHQSEHVSFNFMLIASPEEQELM